MLSHLIKKEVLEHLMSMRFAIACVLCLIVILCSLFIRSQDYNQVLDDYHQESAMEKHRVDAWDHPWHFVWQGVTIYRRPNPLKIFVRGLDDSYGQAVRVASKEQLWTIIRDLQNTAVPLFSPIDLVAFVGLIMSLMAVVFGYDAICGEKERGTLRLMLSYSVPRHQLLLSKWIGGYVTLVVPFLLTVVVGAVIVLLQGNISLNDGQWARLLLIIGLALLYIAAIYSLAICVSCLTHRASTSVMILLSIWVVLVLAVPNLSPYMARLLRPTASAQEQDNARRSASKEIWKRQVEDKMKAYDKEKGFEGFFKDHWWASINWDDWTQVEPLERRWYYELQCEREAHIARLNEYSKIRQHYASRMDEQIRLSRWIGRLSPFSCFALAATELADAGIMEKTRYRTQLQKHHILLCNYAHDEWQALRQYKLDNAGREKGPWNKNRVKPVPSFYYVPPGAREYLGVVATDGGVLVGMMVLFFMLSYVRFLRYDVR